MLLEGFEYILNQIMGTTTWMYLHIMVINIVAEFPPTLIVPIAVIVTLAAVLMNRVRLTKWRRKHP